MTSKLVERIIKLEGAERHILVLVHKIMLLEEFIKDWDSGDPDNLPKSHKAKINPVRQLVDVIKNDKETLLKLKKALDNNECIV
jgi:hypothetical protein